MSSESALWPILHEEIRSAGRITFYRFMELCLYHSQHGYYGSERVKLGAAGDYYTTAHITPVFARLLARHFELLWNELGKPGRFGLVELGSGDGRLASELLSGTRERFPEFFSCLRYVGVEKSAQLRSGLVRNLNCFGDRVRIVQDMPGSFAGSSREEGFQGCVFANEFFDALPFHLLIWRNGRWQERYVSLEGEKLVWSEGDPSSPNLQKEAELRFDPALAPAHREDGWTAELRPLAGRWMKSISQCLGRGEMLIIDYGYTLEEWQQGRFPQGSALAYRRHQVVNDLLSHPGDQDLTAHVNFTQLVESGQQCGLRLCVFQSQAKFLLELGEPDEFRDVFADCASEEERQRRTLLLKTLILPQGMGETFRVLALRKGF